jgi:hypothetical protein
MERKYEINDIRMKKDFSRSSFSGYKRTDVEKLLKKAILEDKIEEAQYWCAELVCIAEYEKLWEIFYLLTSKHIHIANPRIFPYLRLKYETYDNIKSTGYYNYELAMRNNIKIRECFAEVVCILCMSPKMPVLTPLKTKKNEFSILNLQGKLVAKTLDHGKEFLKKDDPDELLISINELAFLCFEKNNEYVNKLNDVIFWLNWMLIYEEHCRKNNISLECATRQSNDKYLTYEQKKDFIWILWDIIFETNLTIHSSDDNTNDTQHFTNIIQNKNEYIKQTEQYKLFINRILEAILFFFKVNYTHTCKKRKITLLYFAYQLIFMPIDTTIQLINKEQRGITETIKTNINIIYEKIKKNEVNPETDYLFNQIEDKNNNRENTQKKLELLNNITDKYIT